MKKEKIMPYSVLLVDDERFVTEALRRVLHKESYEVHCACSAREALALLSREKIDVIVSDEIMPGMSGSDFLGIVCAEYPGTIRLLLTGHPDLDVALSAINKGHVYRFLIKPCNGVELSFTIRQAIREQELYRKSLNLLETARRQRKVLDDLERRNPGITWVGRDIGGAIPIPEVDYDLDALIREIGREVDRSESFFKNPARQDEDLSC